MDAISEARKQKIQEHLLALSELLVEEQVEQGVFLNTPHFSIIEEQARQLGRELSQQAQARAAREVAASCGDKASCCECGAECDVGYESRTVRSLDGPVELLEPVAHCPVCRRDFFPSAL